MVRFLIPVAPLLAAITSLITHASSGVSDSISIHPHVSREAIVVLIAVLALVGLMGYEAVKRWGAESESEEGEAILRGKAF